MHTPKHPPLWLALLLLALLGSPLALALPGCRQAPTPPKSITTVPPLGCRNTWYYE